MTRIFSGIFGPWRLRGRVATAALAASLAGLAAPSRADTVYEDAKAGIRIAIPFARSEQKTAEQVTNLVNADGNVPLATGVSFTGGVYDLASESFFVVWLKADENLPTQRDLHDLAALDGPLAPLVRRLKSWAPVLRGVPDDFHFNITGLKGYGTLRQRRAAKATNAPALKSKALMQLTKNGAAFVGFYYRDESDQGLVEEAFETLAPLPGRSLRLQDLAPGNFSVTSMIGAASVAILAALALALRLAVAGRKTSPILRPR